MKFNEMILYLHEIQWNDLILTWNSTKWSHTNMKFNEMISYWHEIQWNDLISTWNSRKWMRRLYLQAILRAVDIHIHVHTRVYETTIRIKRDQCMSKETHEWDVYSYAILCGSGARRCTWWARTLQQTASRCNTRQYAATHCNILQQPPLFSRHTPSHGCSWMPKVWPAPKKINIEFHVRFNEINAAQRRVHIYAWTCIHVCVYSYSYIHMYTYIDRWIYTCIHICICTDLYIHI